MQIPSKKLGLVLEGGGMRGVYTAGVIDFLLEQNLLVDGVVGVSAGAVQAVSDVCKRQTLHELPFASFDWGPVQQGILL